MRSLSKSRKAQFFVLSAVTIVVVIFFMSRWMEPYTIIDTSTAMMDEPFVFTNIKEKAVETVSTSKNCEDLKFNLEEYTNFVKDYAIRKNLNLNLDYRISQPCDDNLLTTQFNMNMSSPRVFINSSFTANK